MPTDTFEPGPPVHWLMRAIHAVIIPMCAVGLVQAILLLVRAIASGRTWIPIASNVLLVGTVIALGLGSLTALRRRIPIALPYTWTALGFVTVHLLLQAIRG